MKKKKKEIQVLYIITKLELGGAQKVCISLFEGVKENGHESFLISGRSRTDDRKYLENNFVDICDNGSNLAMDGTGIRLANVDHKETLEKKVESNPNAFLLKNLKREVSISGMIGEIKNFFELVKKIKEIKRINPNLIVHTHSTKAGLVGRWAAFFAGVKKRVHTVHGYGFHAHQNKIAWLITYLLELVTSFITTHYVCVSSEDVRKGIILFPRFAKKHTIIRAAVDFDKFYKPAKKLDNLLDNKKPDIFFDHKKPFVFGTVSCFKKQKNLFDLLSAFQHAHAQNHNIKLEILGDGHLRPQLEKWIYDHNFKNKIILHGWQEDVPKFMTTWDAYVMSSLWEGLPCAIIEARLCKLPVLSYKTGGIHEVITNGENGFLYPQKKWKELACGMLAVSCNKYLYKKLQEHQEDLSEFDNQNMINNHIKLYKEL